MVHQTLQAGLCPCGDAELDQTASAKTVNLETHMMQARPARLQELAQVRLGPQRGHSINGHASDAAGESG
jgi:hypothetical protein